MHEEEKHIIGAAIVDIEARNDVLASLTDEHLVHPLSKEVIRVLRETGNREVDVPTLWGMMDSSITDRFNQDILVQAVRDAPFTVGRQIEIARERSVRQAVEQDIRRLRRIIDSSDTSELLAAISSMQAKAERRSFGGSDLVSFKDMVGERVAQIMSGESATKIPTGLPALDRLLQRGVQTSDLTLIAARPGMGKTALMLNVFLNNVNNYDILFFSLEMSHAQIADRLIAIESEIDLTQIILAEAPEENILQTREQLVQKLRSGWFVARGAITPGYIRQTIQRVMLEIGKPPDIVFVDYLQRMSPPEGRRLDNQTQRIGAISSDLKAIAMEFDIALFAASQLSRNCENRQDKRPILSDLRESGDLEQDADNVIFLYRDIVYNDNANPNLAELIVAKHRQGPTGEVHVGARMEINKFFPLTEMGNMDYPQPV